MSSVIIYSIIAKFKDGFHVESSLKAGGSYKISNKASQVSRELFTYVLWKCIESFRVRDS